MVSYKIAEYPTSCQKTEMARNILLYLACTAIVSAQVHLVPDAIRDKYRSVMVEVDQYKGKYKSDYGEVPSVVKCADPGEGKFKKLYVQNCESGKDPCELVADDSQQVFEIVFITSQEIQKLGFRMEVRTEKGNWVKLHEKPIKDSSLIEDKTTVVTTYTPKLSKTLRGQIVEARLTLYQVDDDVNPVELCIKFKIKLV